ncbi:MAG: EipA family protein [Alphaproteobacteria bacterium]|nr:EipA family protein [Alphaproteobacteria bacterium]
MQVKNPKVGNVGRLTRNAAVSAAFVIGLLGVGNLTGVAGGSAVATEACTGEEFSREVDQAGEALRDFNARMSPKLKSSFRRLKTAKGWSDVDAQNLAQDYLFDAKIAGLDNKANDLLTKLDTLGSAGETGEATCEKLNELKATGSELLAVMKAKATYTLAKIDDELAAKDGSGKAASPRGATITRLPDGKASDLIVAPPQAAALKPPVDKGSDGGRAAKPKTATAPAKRHQPKPAPATESSGSWETVTQQSPQAPAGNQDLARLDQGPGGDGQFLQPPPGAFIGPDEGYTVEEIRDATKGFFGTISTNLATVIEHAFGQWGRPTGYVLGKEGGGAFLAGVRYGSGTLFMRSGKRRKVYWHGPSLGYDFGAEGSRTLYLIYSLRHPNDLYRSYTGVDGSAYLIGGVGVTLLKGGPVVLAPIRSGIGLRLGANIGYVRFTPKQTWNPF